MTLAGTLPPPTALQHHQEMCILIAGVNLPRVTVWIGDLVRDAVSTPCRNAHLHTSCMNDYRVRDTVSRSVTCRLTYSQDSMQAHIHTASSSSYVLLHNHTFPREHTHS